MCDENSPFISDIESFSPKTLQNNDNVLHNKHLHPESCDSQKNMEGEEEFMNQVSEDENESYIDISGEVQDFTEVLIGEVQKRPALYNIKSSVQSRTRVIVNQMWQEIFEIFEGQVPVEELKRRWKVQRDRYIKIRSDMKRKLPSGSAATKRHPNYKYYELMSFLDDSMDQRRHVSNICLSGQSQPLASSSNFNISQSKTSHVESPLSSRAIQVPPILASSTPVFSPSTTSSSSLTSELPSYPKSYNFSKSSKYPRHTTAIEDELLRGLSTLKPPTPVLLDSVDHFCHSIAETLRMLDVKNRLSVELGIMQLLHDQFYNS